MQPLERSLEKASASVAGQGMQVIDGGVRDVSIAGMAVPYQAFIEEDWERLKKYLEDDRGTVISPLTVNKDTALHIAIYSGNTLLIDSVIEIAKEVARSSSESPFLVENEYGNTVLHEAAAAGNVKAAKQLLACERKLLDVKNKLGETPLYRAAAFGMTEMVKFLAGEIVRETEPVVRTHRQKGPFMSIHGRRKDATSILHIAVHAKHFETALYLQRTDDALGELKDENSRTSLHLLANMRSAYKSGQPMGKLMGFFYNCLPDNNDSDEDEETTVSSNKKGDLESGMHVYDSLISSNSRIREAISKTYLIIWRCLAEGWPVLDRIWKEKRRHESVTKLTKLLVRKDTSWETSCVEPDIGTISFGEVSAERQRASVDNEEREQTIVSLPTPLLIASSNGIIEIVDEILRVHPQAVEHVSDKGQNILHVAVKHRQREIFRRVKKMKIPMTISVRKIDANGYTLLHHAADMHNYYGGHKPSPVLQLQGELRWFERVKKIIPSHYIMHHNKKGKTALALFEETHAKLHKDAQEWLKRTSESCSVIAVLIATVAFTAIYTVPGGTDDKTGRPILLRYAFFSVFTVLDIVSLASSLTSVVMFLSILTSPFRLEDFRTSLPRKLTLGFTFLFFSVAATMLAFSATIVLEIHLKEQWSRSLIYTVAFLPVTAFALMQFPLYLAFTGTIKSSIKVFRKALPWTFISGLCRKTKLYIRGGLKMNGSSV